MCFKSTFSGRFKMIKDCEKGKYFRLLKGEYIKFMICGKGMFTKKLVGRNGVPKMP